MNYDHCPVCGAAANGRQIGGVPSYGAPFLDTAVCGWSAGIPGWSDYPSKPCGTPPGPERDAALAAAKAAVKAKRDAERAARLAHESTLGYRFWRVMDDARRDRDNWTYFDSDFHSFREVNRRYEELARFRSRYGSDEAAGAAYFAEPAPRASAFSSNPRGTGPFWALAQCVAHHLGLI